jgi:hypothetical protein
MPIYKQTHFHVDNFVRMAGDAVLRETRVIRVSSGGVDLVVRRFQRILRGDVLGLRNLDRRTAGNFHTNG